MSKRYDYVVTLKKTSQRTTDLISILLIFFSVVNFGFEQAGSRHFNYFLSAIILILLIGTPLNIFKARRNSRDRKAGIPETPKDLVRYKYLLLAAALGWLGMSHLQWLFLLFILLAFLEYQAKHPLEIGFCHEQVVINSLLKRKYPWSVFSNIVLRDGLLTLDFRDNRLFQKEVLDDEEGEAEEDEFNAYCLQRLQAPGAAAGPDDPSRRS